MSEYKGFSGAQIALAFLGGAATGAAVAILTAPKSGRETREQLSGAFRREAKKISRVRDAIVDADSVDARGDGEEDYSRRL
jgi:gas vesicle protein